MNVASNPIMSERRVTLLTAMIAGIGPISLALYTPAMPALVTAFSTDNTSVKLTLSVYFAGFAAAQLVTGPLSDRFGRKPVTMAFLSLYLFGSIGTLLASSISVFTFFRLIQGLGAAAGLVIGRAIVRDLFTGQASARVINLKSILLGIGPAIGPAIGSLAMLVAGWQAPLVVMLAMGVTALVLVWYFLVETRPLQSVPPGVAMVLKDYAVILRNQSFLWSSLTVSFGLAGFYAQSTVLPFIIMNQLEYTATHYGLFMFAISGGYVAGALTVRQLVGRWSTFRLVLVGLVIMTAGASVLCISLLLDFDPTAMSIIIPVTVMVYSNSFVLPGMQTAGLAPFPDRAGSASSLIGFMSMGLGLLASLMAGYFASPFMGLVVASMATAFLASLSFFLLLRQRQVQPI